MKKILLLIAVLISLASYSQTGVVTTTKTEVIKGSWYLQHLDFQNMGGHWFANFTYLQKDTLGNVIDNYNFTYSDTAFNSFWANFNSGWNAYVPLQQYLGIPIDTTRANNSFLNQ